jgi:hypothetical protein
VSTATTTTTTTEIVRPPERSELGAEGNLLEAPIFELYKQGARPRTKEGLIDLKDYRTDCVFRRVHKDGVVQEHRLAIDANPQFGRPTYLAARILFSLIRECQRMNFRSPRVRCSLADLCRWLEVAPGGRWYLLIIQQLDAMKFAKYAFHYSWWMPAEGGSPAAARDATASEEEGSPAGRWKGAPRGSTGTYFPGVKTVSLIADYQFAPLVKKQLRTRNEQLGLNLENWVELGGDIFQSARVYGIPLDLAYQNALSSDTARRLYAYLAKRHYQKHEYQERIVTLGPRLPLRKTAPSAIREALEGACAELVLPIGPEKKRFLDAYQFRGVGRETVLGVWFYGASRSEELRARLLAREKQADPAGQ